MARHRAVVAWQPSVNQLVPIVFGESRGSALMTGAVWFAVHGAAALGAERFVQLASDTPGRSRPADSRLNRQAAADRI